MSVYDVDNELYQRDLDMAFERGREECDEYVMAECVALRVKLAKHQAATYRQGIAAGLMCACFFCAVLLFCGLVGLLVFA